LHFAAFDGDLKRVNDILAAGERQPDVIAQTPWGYTPLHASADHGAIIKPSRPDRKPRHDANAAVISALVAAGAAVDETVRYGSEAIDLTPFMLALASVHCECLGALLGAGADLGHQATMAFHAIVHSGRRGASTCVRHLLAHGVDPRASSRMDEWSNTPLDTLQEAHDHGNYDETPEEYAKVYSVLSSTGAKHASLRSR